MLISHLNWPSSPLYTRVCKNNSSALYLFCASNSLNLAPCFLPVSVPSPANNGLIVGLAFTNSDSGIIGALVSIGFVTVFLSNSFFVSSISPTGLLAPAICGTNPLPPPGVILVNKSFTLSIPFLTSLAPPNAGPEGDNTSPAIWYGSEASDGIPSAVIPLSKASLPIYCSIFFKTGDIALAVNPAPVEFLATSSFMKFVRDTASNGIPASPVIKVPIRVFLIFSSALGLSSNKGLPVLSTSRSFLCIFSKLLGILAVVSSI